MLTPFNYGGSNEKVPTESRGGLTPFKYEPYTPPPAPVAPQSLISRATSSIKNYAQASADTVVPFGDAVLHPIDTAKKVANAYIDPFVGGLKRAGTGVKELVSEPGMANKVADTADIIAGLAETAFSPITGTFKVAEHTPGLKQVADVLSIPPTALGIGGSFATGKVVDWMPISQESKDIIKAPLQEVGSLAAQVLLMGKVMSKVSEFSKAKDIKELTPVEAKRIVEEAKAETVQKPVVETTTPTLAPELPSGPVSAATRPLDTNRVSGVAQRIEADAVEKGLIKAGETDLAGYNGFTRKDVYEKITYEINLGDKNLKDLLTGEKPLPEGIPPQKMSVAIENYLERNPNPELSLKLLKSELTGSRSQAGSDLAASKGANPNSILAQLKDVQKRLVAKTMNYDKKKVSIDKEIREAVKKSTLEPKDLGRLDKFIDKVTCA